MKTLQYNQYLDHPWVGCSSEEVKTQLFPFKNGRQIAEYLQKKKEKRLVVTHNDGVPFPDQPARRKLYFDMDGTLVDFKSGMDKVDPNILEQHKSNPEDIEGIFSLMEPMPGAIEAVNQLKDIYDCYILSTAPWDNPSAWSDKLLWVQKHLSQPFYKRVILTHHKELLNDGESILIDDRDTHGAGTFGENLINFKEIGSWEKVTKILWDRAKEDDSGLNVIKETWAMKIARRLTEAGCPMGHKTGSCIVPAPKHLKSVDKSKD